MPKVENVNSKNYVAHAVNLSVSGNVTDYYKFVSFYLSLGFYPAKYGAVLTTGAFIEGLRNLATSDCQLYNDMLCINCNSIKDRPNEVLSSLMGFVLTIIISSK